MNIRYLLLVCLLFLGVCSFAQIEQDITDISDGKIISQYDDSPNRESVENLIDNNLASKFLSFHSSTWVMFYLPKAYILSKYTLTSGNDAPERDPKNWVLEGSHNGVTFYLIDEQKGQDFLGRNTKRNFSIAESEAYSYFRLTMENHSGSILQLSELELFGTEGEPFTELLVDFSINSYQFTNQSVSFTNASLNASKINWTFDGGQPANSAEDNPEVIYPTPGNYEVKLTVENGKETKTKIETITVKDINDWSSFKFPTVDLGLVNK